MKPQCFRSIARRRVFLAVALAGFASPTAAVDLWVGYVVALDGGDGFVWAVTWDQPSREAAIAALVAESRKRGGEFCDHAASATTEPCVGLGTHVATGYEEG